MSRFVAGGDTGRNPGSDPKRIGIKEVKADRIAQIVLGIYGITYNKEPVSGAVEESVDSPKDSLPAVEGLRDEQMPIRQGLFWDIHQHHP